MERSSDLLQTLLPDMNNAGQKPGACPGCGLDQVVPSKKITKYLSEILFFVLIGRHHRPINTKYFFWIVVMTSGHRQA
jgi:hypothetical protein